MACRRQRLGLGGNHEGPTNTIINTWNSAKKTFTTKIIALETESKRIFLDPSTTVPGSLAKEAAFRECLPLVERTLKAIEEAKATIGPDNMSVTVLECLGYDFETSYRQNGWGKEKWESHIALYRRNVDRLLKQVRRNHENVIKYLELVEKKENADRCLEDLKWGFEAGHGWFEDGEEAFDDERGEGQSGKG